MDVRACLAYLADVKRQTNCQEINSNRHVYCVISCVRKKRVGTRQKGGKKIPAIWCFFTKSSSFLLYRERLRDQRKLRTEGAAAHRHT